MEEKEVIPKIVVKPPGPKAREIIKLDDEYISPSYSRYYPLVISEAKGAMIKDVDGNQYIDFNAGLAVMNVGHCHNRIVEKIKEQSEKFIHYSNTDFYYPQVPELAKMICDITPGNFQKNVFFGNSGTEAIEAGFKLARWYTRRSRVIAFIGGFHGRTFGSLSFTASKIVQRRYFFPLVPSVTHVPYGNCYRCAFKLEYPDCGIWCVGFIDEMVLQKYIPPEEVCGIIFEPIQGEGGYVVPPDEFFPKLKRLADKYELLLIDDEIQTGLGRTGKWFAIEHWGVVPDILCLAKGIASGLPLGATVSHKRIMDWEPGSHSSTFGGNPIACVVGQEVIKVIEEEKILENTTKQGNYILSYLNELKDKFELIGDVRGKGLMIGIELVLDKKTKKPARKETKNIILECFKKGLAIITAGRSVIRICPPLIIDRILIDKGLEILEKAISIEEKKTYPP